MNVIGLGQAGCNIADALSKYSQYKIYKIDVGIESDFDFAEQYGEAEESKRVYKIKHQKGPEEYEKNVPSMKAFFGHKAGNFSPFKKQDLA